METEFRPRRKGIPKCYSFDRDAVALLKVLCPNSHGHGMLLSELIRREAERRVERPRLLAELAELVAQERD